MWVTGCWPDASDAVSTRACLLPAACHVFDGGDQIGLTPRLGYSEVRGCFVPDLQVTIVDTWEVSGLAGTGSR